MEIIKLLNDFKIPYNETGKNISGGWIGVQCPFCNDTSDHLGYNVEDDYGFNCWKCGKHSITETISELTGLSYSQTKKLLKQYEGQDYKKQVKIKPKKKKHKFPSKTLDLQPIHEKYLQNRNFTPEYLEELWRIKGTRIISSLDGIDLKHRIIVPIHWDKQEVSWQSRDVTNQANIKYITCPQEREIIHHKDIVYKHPDYKGEIGIACEGVFDVWRFGKIAFCTFGINFTQRQIRVISLLYRKVYIAFDPEPQAQKQALILQKELQFRGVECKVLTLISDPADMKQSETDNIVKRIKNNQL